MQRVQLALDSDAPGRPAGPALGTEVPAKNWHWLALGTGVPAKDCHWPELGTPVPAPVQTLGTAALARSDKKCPFVPSFCAQNCSQIYSGTLSRTIQPFAELIR